MAPSVGAPLELTSLDRLDHLHHPPAPSSVRTHEPRPFRCRLGGVDIVAGARHRVQHSAVCHDRLRTQSCTYCSGTVPRLIDQCVQPPSPYFSGSHQLPVKNFRSSSAFRSTEPAAPSSKALMFRNRLSNQEGDNVTELVLLRGHARGLTNRVLHFVDGAEVVARFFAVFRPP